MAWQKPATIRHIVYLPGISKSYYMTWTISKMVDNTCIKWLQSIGPHMVRQGYPKNRASSKP